MSQEYGATIQLENGRVVEVEKAYDAIMAVANRNSKNTPVMNLKVVYNGEELTGNDIIKIMNAYQQDALDSHENKQQEMMHRNLQIQQILSEKKEIEKMIDRLNDRLVELNNTLKDMKSGKGKKKRKGKKGKRGKKGKSKKKGKNKRKGGTRKR